MWHQVADWKAGHKRECDRPSLLTRDERQLMATLARLENEGNTLAVLGLEKEALALACSVKEKYPEIAKWILQLFSMSNYNSANYERARVLLEQARAIFEALGDRAGVAKVLGNLGNCYYRTGDYVRASELHEEERVMAKALGDRAGFARACGNLGNCYYRTRDYQRARRLHVQRWTVSESLGDLSGVASACSNLGNCYYSMGDFARAIELHEKDRALSEALGNREALAGACCNIGICYYNTSDYARARQMHEQSWAICEALGDRAGMARASCNLGNCYQRTGEYGRAIQLHEQDRALCEALGNHEGVAMACGNMGLCYETTGDYGRACELYEQNCAMAKAAGDWNGVANAWGNLGDCSLNTGDHGQAISYYTKQYEVTKGLRDGQAEHASLGVGVALRLEVRAKLRGCHDRASEVPGPHACASERSEDSVREAEKWLRIALDLGNESARLHLARLALDAGLEDTALVHLHAYLSWCVELGRKQCAGCDQIRDENTQMLTCGGCRVARFCSPEHQKMASKRVAAGGSLVEGRHRDICGVLGNWRVQVVKRGMSPDVLRADLLSFLRK
jgi:tetratricopeptide (TPR) repeat protein